MGTVYSLHPQNNTKMGMATYALCLVVLVAAVDVSVEAAKSTGTVTNVNRNAGMVFIKPDKDTLPPGVSQKLEKVTAFNYYRKINAGQRLKFNIVYEDYVYKAKDVEDA